MKSLNDNITNDNAPVNCELDKSRLTESSSEYVDKNDTKTNTQTSAITENYKHEEKKEVTYRLDPCRCYRLAYTWNRYPWRYVAYER